MKVSDRFSGNYCLIPVCVLMLVIMSSAQATVIYDVNQTVGTGTVTGHITTDSTIGTITAANIVDWALAFSVDGLNGAVSSSDIGSRFEVNGTNLSATSTDLLFEFNDGSSLFIGNGDSSSFWFLVDDSAFSVPFERIRVNSLDVSFQTVAYQPGDIISIASVSSTTVPEPTTLALLGLGLFSLGFNKRKKGK